MNYNPNIGGPLDQPIIDILQKFNALGLTTKASCAGYPFPGHGSGAAFNIPDTNSRPYVWFEDMPQTKLNLIKKIIHGTKFNAQYGWFNQSDFRYPPVFMNEINLPDNMSNNEKIRQWSLLRTNLIKIGNIQYNDFLNQW